MSLLRRIAKRFPPLRDLHRYILDLERERDTLRAELAHWKTWMSPGHFYSPIPSIDEVRAREASIFGEPPQSLPGIDLNLDRQLALVRDLAVHSSPFPARRDSAYRYWFENDSYGYADGVMLYGMLRHVRPKRVIEIGCGMSSALMLDTDPSIDFTFIDPDPAVLQSVAREGDLKKLMRKPLQDVPIETFDALRRNDILFIDSTHVAKTGSDVNRIVFDILPRLASGVVVHIHDIFYPFEYPREWVYEGRAWNEDYIVRAFLEFNSAFSIVLFANYLYRMHRETLAAAMPLAVANAPGGLWLQRN